MDFEAIKITTKMLLAGAASFAGLDAVIISLLAWRIKLPTFRRMKWTQVCVAGVVWFLIWTWAITNFWETVYGYLFPPWARGWIPPAFGLLMAGVSLGLWALAVRVKQPVVTFCLLGGAWGVCTHTWAVYLGVVTKPPMLQGASPLAALFIAFFEYAFYWCIITSLSALLVRVFIPGKRQ